VAAAVDQAKLRLHDNCCRTEDVEEAGFALLGDDGAAVAGET